MDLKGLVTNIMNTVHQQIWLAKINSDHDILTKAAMNLLFVLTQQLMVKYFLYCSKRKRGYEEDGHVSKEPRITEEVG